MALSQYFFIYGGGSGAPTSTLLIKMVDGGTGNGKCDKNRRRNRSRSEKALVEDKTQSAPDLSVIADKQQTQGKTGALPLPLLRLRLLLPADAREARSLPSSPSIAPSSPSLNPSQNKK